MVIFLFLAEIISIVNSPIRNRKKKIVPEKKGAPKLFTNRTSKDDAKEIVPGITPT